MATVKRSAWLNLAELTAGKGQTDEDTVSCVNACVCVRVRLQVWAIWIMHILCTKKNTNKWIKCFFCAHWKGLVRVFASMRIWLSIWSCIRVMWRWCTAWAIQRAKLSSLLWNNVVLKCVLHDLKRKCLNIAENIPKSGLRTQPGEIEFSV